MCYVFVSDYLQSKFDKRIIRYIFIDYDNERKGWRCYDPTRGHCYTSRNVVFDEASSWWSSQEVRLSDFKEIKEKMKQQLGDHSKVKEKESGQGFVEGEVEKDETPNK